MNKYNLYIHSLLQIHTFMLLKGFRLGKKQKHLLYFSKPKVDKIRQTKQTNK